MTTQHGVISVSERRSSANSSGHGNRYVGGKVYLSGAPRPIPANGHVGILSGLVYLSGAPRPIPAKINVNRLIFLVYLSGAPRPIPAIWAAVGYAAEVYLSGAPRPIPAQRADERIPLLVYLSGAPRPIPARFGKYPPTCRVYLSGAPRPIPAQDAVLAVHTLVYLSGAPRPIPAVTLGRKHRGPTSPPKWQDPCGRGRRSLSHTPWSVVPLAVTCAVLSANSVADCFGVSRHSQYQSPRSFPLTGPADCS